LTAIGSHFPACVAVIILPERMTFQWIITPEDEQRYREFVAKYQAHPLVIERLERNVQRTTVDISADTVWARVVSCLLTTQQKSGRASRVARFIQKEERLFSFTFCRESDCLAAVAKEALKQAGLRRSERISAEICHAMTVFKESWQEFELTLGNLYDQPHAKAERAVARWIQDQLKGFGPKQSRNLLQWLGLSQHEVPLDSRMMKVLRRLNFPVPLSREALADEEYYCFVLDGLHTILARIEVKPCVFDACAFASFERD